MEGAVIKNIFIKVSKRFTVKVEIHALGYDNWYQDAVHDEEITSAVLGRAKERIFLEEQLKIKKKRKRWEKCRSDNNIKNMTVSDFYEMQHISGTTLRMIHCFEKRSTAKVHLLITNFGEKKSSVCKDHTVFKEKMIVKAYPLDRYQQVQMAAEQERTQTNTSENIALISTKQVPTVSSYFNDSVHPAATNVDQQESLKAILKKQQQNKKLKRHKLLMNNNHSDSTICHSPISTDYNKIHDKFNLTEDEQAIYGNLKVTTIKSNATKYTNINGSEVLKCFCEKENQCKDCYEIPHQKSDIETGVLSPCYKKPVRKDINLTNFGGNFEEKPTQFNPKYDVYEFNSSPDDISDELPTIKRQKRCILKDSVEQEYSVSKKYGRSAHLHQLASEIISEDCDENDFEGQQGIIHDLNNKYEEKSDTYHSKNALCNNGINDVSGDVHLASNSSHCNDSNKLNKQKAESFVNNSNHTVESPKKVSNSLKTNKFKKRMLSVSSDSETEDMEIKDTNKPLTKTVFPKSVLSNCKSTVNDSTGGENVPTNWNKSETYIKKEGTSTFVMESGYGTASEDTTNLTGKPVEHDHQTGMEIEDILSDCFILEELSADPAGVSEDDSFKRELKNIRDVKDLQDEQIEYLVKRNEMYLRNIFQGKSYCRRHQDYKKGGASRVDLTYQVKLELITEEQQDVVMESLIKMFCKRHHKYLDYIMKVMLPEILIKIYMDIHEVTHAETEEHLLEV